MSYNYYYYGQYPRPSQPPPPQFVSPPPQYGYPSSSRYHSPSTNGQNFLSELYNLDEAYHVHGTISKREYEQCRQALLDNSASSTSVPSAAGQDFLQKLNSLDEAYHVHRYISKREYKQYRQAILDNSASSTSVRSTVEEQNFLRELSSLDQARYVHNYINNKEYEKYRKKIIDKWKGSEKKSFWSRMWDTATRFGNTVFQNLLSPIMSNLGNSLIGGFGSHAGFIGQ